MDLSPFTFRRIEKNDRIWIDSFIKEHWGSDLVVVHSALYYPGKLNGYIACEAEKRIGLITYIIQNADCEIVTLNSIIENQGIGSKLINLVEKEAKRSNCRRLWLITTNDNTNAIRFYQKRGFEWAGFNKNAIKESRKIKPEIPLLGSDNIPIKHEIEFEYILD